MLFNSIDFAIFLPSVFFLYWFIANRNLKVQNLFIVTASYFFYGWWDWRFLSLIAISTLVDFSVGLGLSYYQSPRKRKALLLISIIVNLGLLGFFKYYNFFLENFIAGYSFVGKEISPNSLSIVLPVGISFYTFQTLSYTIDVYKRKIKPNKDFIAFAAFVSFFPQLVAGPIERAYNLLPQFYNKRIFDYSKAVDGMRQILWGLMKKIVIADNCAEYVDIIFNNYSDYNGSTLLIGAVLFSIQIYGDFSGYSDIAIGTSRLFGFNIMRNFAFPYFSRDIAEFWRRWHISLSSWFRDYLYIPLGGSRGTVFSKIRNIFVIFLVSGFWHGANWTFIFWGALNALYYLPLLFFNRNRVNLDDAAKGKIIPSFREFINIVVTYSLTVFAWIFFRSESVSKALSFMGKIFSFSLFSNPSLYPAQAQLSPKTLLLLIFVFFIIEWIQREKQHAMQIEMIKIPWMLRWAIYSFIIFIIGMYMPTGETPFIYFQF
jgi:D-alanyl-lipoteichoic acid acyltransferase DltB (MBOAT superfamily)